MPFDLGSLYCLFRRTFAHFTKMCIKKQGKAWAERRERERKVSFLACSADTNMRLLKFPIFRLVVTIKLGFLSERKHPTIYASVATSILRKKRKAKEETFFLFHLPFFLSARWLINNLTFTWLTFYSISLHHHWPLTKMESLNMHEIPASFLHKMSGKPTDIFSLEWHVFYCSW